MRIVALALIACLLPAVSAQASTIHVPGEQPTIQAGLNACVPGDTVLVAAGTYFENIVWPATQSIVLKSESGPESTVIDGGSPSHPDSGSVILFAGGQDVATVLDGFTITNGQGTLQSYPSPSYVGGGIYVRNSLPTITANIITGNNHARIAGGGGIMSEDSAPVIAGNVISNNRAVQVPFGFGGGVFCGSILCHECAATITGNEITGNVTRVGGGIAAFDTSPLIDGNTISGNTATGNGGGIGFSQGFPGSTDPGCAPEITGNAITDNTAQGGFGGGIAGYGPTGGEDPYIAGNAITGNTGGGIRLSAFYGPNRAVVEYCCISGNIGHGVRCDESAAPTIEHCLISSNNDADGVFCASGGAPEIHYSDIHGHAPGYGVRNIYAAVTINAELNWWGHASGPTHPGNPGGLGDRVSDYVDYTPWATSSGVAGPVSEVPRGQLVLGQNRPNPFNPTTEIAFDLPAPAAVRLCVYDAGGRVIQMLVNSEVRSAGSYRVSWDGRDQSGRSVPSGVYFYRLDAGPYNETRRMVLAR